MRCSISCLVSNVRPRRRVAFNIIPVLCLIASTALPASGFGQIPGTTLREQLKSLQRLHGIEVRGLDRVGDEPARPTTGDLRRQVMSLLSNYSYVVLQTADDDVRGVRILASQGSARPDVRPAVRAPSEGAAAKKAAPINGQTLNATLMGFGGREYDMTFVIDDRAQAVVLPAAMKVVLGFEGVELQGAVTTTAAGKVDAEVGLLPAIRAGGVVAENVDVAFVADDAAGGRALLGQSFLKNFQVTYDKATAQLLLMPR
jgi:hypothetical protein